MLPTWRCLTYSLSFPHFGFLPRKTLKNTKDLLGSLRNTEKSIGTPKNPCSHLSQEFQRKKGQGCGSLAKRSWWCLLALCWCLKSWISWSNCVVLGQVGGAVPTCPVVVLCLSFPLSEELDKLVELCGKEVGAVPTWPVVLCLPLPYLKSWISWWSFVVPGFCPISEVGGGWWCFAFLALSELVESCQNLPYLGS